MSINEPEVDIKKATDVYKSIASQSEIDEFDTMSEDDKNLFIKGFGKNIQELQAALNPPPTPPMGGMAPPPPQDDGLEHWRPKQQNNQQQGGQSQEGKTKWIDYEIEKAEKDANDIQEAANDIQEETNNKNGQQQSQSTAQSAQSAADAAQQAASDAQQAASDAQQAANDTQSQANKSGSSVDKAKAQAAQAAADKAQAAADAAQEAAQKAQEAANDAMSAANDAMNADNSEGIKDAMNEVGKATQAAAQAARQAVAKGNEAKEAADKATDLNTKEHISSEDAANNAISDGSRAEQSKSASDAQQAAQSAEDAANAAQVEAASATSAARQAQQAAQSAKNKAKNSNSSEDAQAAADAAQAAADAAQAAASAQQAAANAREAANKAKELADKASNGDPSAAQDAGKAAQQAGEAAKQAINDKQSANKAADDAFKKGSQIKGQQQQYNPYPSTDEMKESNFADPNSTNIEAAEVDQNGCGFDGSDIFPGGCTQAEASKFMDEIAKESDMPLDNDDHNALDYGRDVFNEAKKHQSSMWNHSRGFGNNPFDAIDKIIALFMPIISWKTKLKKHFNALRKEEEEEIRLNNKITAPKGSHLWTGRYLKPEDEKIDKISGITDVFFLLDNSESMGLGDKADANGSKGDRLLAHLFTEVIALEKETKVERSAVAWFGADVIEKSQIRTWTSKDGNNTVSKILKELARHPGDNGGGTCVATAIRSIKNIGGKYYRKSKPNTLLIVVTDGVDNYNDLNSILTPTELMRTIFLIVNEPSFLKEITKILEDQHIPSANIIPVDITNW